MALTISVSLTMTKSNTRKYITRKGFKQRKDAVKKCNEMMDELEGVGHLNRLPLTSSLKNI